MNKVFLGSRIVLGLIMLVFGLNGFLNFLPPQPPPPEAAMGFIMGLVNTGYMMKLVKAIEVAVGIMLLLNVMSALSLILIAPIVVNILLFHIVLAPEGAIMGIFVTALTLIAAYEQKEKYAPLFKMR